MGAAALVLLFAQQIAWVHPLEHLRGAVKAGAPPATQVTPIGPVGGAAGASPEAAHAEASCLKCLALGSLGAGLTAAELLPAVVTLPDGVPTDRCEPRHGTQTAFRLARGPPGSRRV